MSVRTRTSRWLDRGAFIVVAIDLLLLAALGAYLLRGGAIVNNAIDIWFDKTDPTLDTLRLERQLFGNDTWMLATVWVRPERNEATGEVVRTLTERLARIEGVTRVISPSSLDVLQDDGQGLFYGPLDEPAWPRLRRRLLRHPFAGGLLVHRASAGQFSLLIKEHTGPTTPGTVRQRLVADIRETIDRHPDVAASAVAGTAVINADLNRLSWQDFTVLVPTTVVVACVVLVAMLRFRWRTTLAILLPIGLTTGALIAAMLLSGRPFSMVTIALPGLTFTLGVASSLHVTGWIVTYLREGRGTGEDATRDARRELIRPILVAQITTALGFGLLALVPVTPVQEMALFGAAGELLAGLHVVFVMPRALHWCGAFGELADGRSLFAGDAWTGRVLGTLATWLAGLQRVRGRLLAAMVAVVAVMGWLTSQVRYDSTYVHMIQAEERLRQDYARFEAASLPSAQLSIVVTRAAATGSVEASLNAAILAASADIEALPQVAKVVGPASIFAEVAPALAADQPLARFAADDGSVTDAYAFALSGGNTEIPSYVHDGLGAYRLVVFFPYLDNARLERLTRQEIPAILQARLGHLPDVSARLSGITVLWANMDDAMSRGQIASIVVMALACLVTFFLSLRDWPLAACAMFVNVLPVAVISALLGATGRPIDMATVFIMGISLGIAVDDTSFFIHEYLHRRGPGGRTPGDALAVTLRHTGPTMVATCLVIVLGFSVLLVSAFIPMRTFGGLTAAGLVLAMLCDLFVLSFLLLAVTRKVHGVRHVEDGVVSPGVLHAHGDGGRG
jgi:predicted RND superfamily exporter protein